MSNKIFPKKKRKIETDIKTNDVTKKYTSGWNWLVYILFIDLFKAGTYYIK